MYLLAARNTDADWALVLKHFKQAGNLTDEIAGLALLRRAGKDDRDMAFARFYDRWHADHLVIDHWFSLQAMMPGPAALATVKRLTKHPLFSMRNPNKVRALVFAFAGNQTNFHRPDGQGYGFIADKVRELDAINPQIAARLLGGFRTWRTLEPDRRKIAEATLKELAKTKPLSRDVYEIATKMLD